MGFEKTMEDAIVSDPEKYVGEKGLKLIARQYRIGKYIFDLLFEDRHGGKLLVELQNGILDRNHTYKILEYRDEYKEAHPKDFIDVMVIANSILSDRKRRLRTHGIEFKEIPESEFLESSEDKESKPEENINQLKPGKDRKKSQSEERMNSITFYIDQAHQFRDELKRYDHNIYFKSPKASEGKRVIYFWPNPWQIRPKQKTGVCISFKYSSDRSTKEPFVRFYVSVEEMEEAYKKKFKDEVVAELKERKIDLPGFDLWPNAGGSSEKTKLLETRLPLNENSWKGGIEAYKKMEKFRSVVAEKVAEFKKKGYTK